MKTVAKTKGSDTVPSDAAVPTSHRIRDRAYEIYEDRRDDGSQGDAVSDWLKAEREINGADRSPERKGDGAKAERTEGS